MQNPKKCQIEELCYPIMIFGRLRSVQRLCQMRRLDLFTPREICNRAGQFEDTMIGTRRQVHLTHRSPLIFPLFRGIEFCQIALND